MPRCSILDASAVDSVARRCPVTPVGARSGPELGAEVERCHQSGQNVSTLSLSVTHSASAAMVDFSTPSK